MNIEYGSSVQMYLLSQTLICMSKKYKRKKQFNQKNCHEPIHDGTTHEFPVIFCKFAAVFELSLYFCTVMQKFTSASLITNTNCY